MNVSPKRNAHLFKKTHPASTKHTFSVGARRPTPDPTPDCVAAARPARKRHDQPRTNPGCRAAARPALKMRRKQPSALTHSNSSFS